MINFNNADFEKSIGNLSQMTDDKLPEIVFSGRSNVGKSSLINKILNRKSLARVSSKPGKTVNINLYNLKNIRFVDLPGYGYAKVSFDEKKRWSNLVEGYFRKSKNIRLFVQIVDMRHTPSAQDFQMLDFLYSKKIPFIVAASKCDKLNKTQKDIRTGELSDEFSEYKNINWIACSSVTGEGIDIIKSLIVESI